MDRLTTDRVAPAITRWRSETPGCEGIVHLNNAGASLMPRPVHEAIVAHLDLEQELGGYEAADFQSDAIQKAYAAMGRLLGTEARNVALVQNSTVAFAQAISAFD